jgi:hypothetical protein
MKLDLKHDWYRDTFSEIDGGRVCRRCRFREHVLTATGRHEECFGDRRLYDMAFKEGRSAGSADRANEIKHLLGLA